MNRRLLYLVALGCAIGGGRVQAQAVAGEQTAAAPKQKWALDFKGGAFYPEIDDWSEFYSGDSGLSAGMTVSRAFGRIFELALDGTHFHDRGQGFYPANNQPGGNMLYESYTLGVGINLRLPVALWGWFTPYAGASAVRVYYDESINSGDRRQGYRDGAMARAGMRLTLDDLEPSGARVLQNDFGILNTMLVVEWQQIETDDVNGFDLGGESIYLGLRFEL